ncbi:MAG TPA: class I SAM-dependent methyltransferase [Gemmatales bacterium]|nr:class I SAM-dependent methyltransferase [Gemmatales bacterium]
MMTGHELLARRVINPRAFDVRGCKMILDAGCGNGRYLRLLQKQSDPDAIVVGCDFSSGMLRRARMRLRSHRAHLLTADLNRLPYADATFDAVVCGWVLEHLQDPLVGLSELARVTRPGGRLLLLTTEHSILGAMCSWFYHNRMSKRSELRDVVRQAGLEWYRERWWTHLHKLLRAGGIVVELRRAQR